MKRQILFDIEVYGETCCSDLCSGLWNSCGAYYCQYFDCNLKHDEHNFVVRCKQCIDAEVGSKSMLKRKLTMSGESIEGV